MTTFREWMQQVSHLSKKSIENYDGALNGALSDWARLNDIHSGALSEITDSGAFARISKKISELTVFKARNARGKGMYAAALSGYRDYLVWLENGAGMATETSLDPKLEEARQAWIARIQGLETCHQLSHLQLNLKSPKFQFGNWCVGAEHQRQFRSVVLKWLGPGDTLPARIASSWEYCPKSERSRKGWLYRRYLALEDIETLLIELSESQLTEEQFKTLQEQRLVEAFGRSSAAREKRLAEADKKPKSYDVKTKVFDRNPDVVVAVLLRANGICETCGEPAPFLRRSNQSPYLEVHHRIPLAENGDDIVENAVAICPNCHRQAHYG